MNSFGKRVAALGLALSVLAFNAQLASAQAAPAAPAAPPLTPAEAKIKTLDRGQIDALLKNPGKILFIDVRRADEVSTIGGFPAFLSIQNADLEKLLPYIPHDRQIVTVSNHAHRAIRAAALLAGKGFHVAGAAGVQDYEAQGGTLTGKKAVAVAAAVGAAK